MDLSVVIPALNEERTVHLCVSKALDALSAMDNVRGEVIVVDNGSEDGTSEAAARAGARVIREPVRGYGSALMAGFEAARGRYILMADADDSYDLGNIRPFWEKLMEGEEFVIGNRFRGTIENGAMPFLHRYLGTPFLTAAVNFFFKAGIGDTNCGMRAMTREACLKIKPRAEAMEFAIEQVIRAALLDLRIAEVPCNLNRDKRERPPHLKTWKDGWRYLCCTLSMAFSSHARG
ncbi:MAG TPA: glycosyltransferase family 2 protein [Verrucomicrobiae bacterium]|nr:glycosyltransferase family 2 protein [Verrucomicrobiae bacterium]